MNNNPFLGTIAYKVELADFTAEIITANIISENLLAQVDEERHLQVIIYKTIYHRRDVNYIEKEDAFTVTTNGINRRKINKAG